MAGTGLQEGRLLGAQEEQGGDLEKKKQWTFLDNTVGLEITPN